MEELRDLFEHMTTNELSYLLKILNIKKVANVKLAKIQTLVNYYSDKDSIKRLFAILNKYEQELLTCIVQSAYNAAIDDLDRIAEKHSVKYSSWSRRKYYDDNSKLHAIIINGQIPMCFRADLDKIIPEYEPTFDILENIDPNDYKGKITNRADRYSDFDMLVKFVNNQNAATTKSGKLMSKSSLIKFHKIAGYEEILQNEMIELSEIKKAGDTTVSYGIIQLLLAANVLEIRNDKYILGEKATYFVGLDTTSKAKFLYDRYINDIEVIDESKRITANKYSFGRLSYDLTSCRKSIIEMLKFCPSDKWIDATVFKRQVRRIDYKFLRNIIDDLYIRDEYYRQYYNAPTWNEFEFFFIDVVLMEYLAVIGAVDVCTLDDSDDYDTRVFPVVQCFKITELGLFLFGLTNEYNAKQNSKPSDAKGFVVQPNFDIIVANGTQSLTHEIYFERFLTKTTADAAVSVFKLNFSGIVKALEIGLNISDIRDYLQSCSTVPISENIISTLNEWKAQSSRIRIRTVTVVETDDNFLLEELKSYKGMKENVLGEIKNAIIIAPQKSQKVKRLIEKNKRFCIVSE